MVSAQLPNHSFEVWADTTAPLQWSTWYSTFSFQVLAPLAVPATGVGDYRSGDTAIKLSTQSVTLPFLGGVASTLPGYLGLGVAIKSVSGPVATYPYNKRPTSLRFSYKMTANDTRTDSASANVILTKWNSTAMRPDTILYKRYFLTDSNGIWHDLTVPLSYLSAAIPDTLQLFFKTNDNINGTRYASLWLDSVSLDASSTGIATVYNYPLDISLYPNPAYDHIIIGTPLIDRAATVCMYDIYGTKVYQTSIAGEQTTIPVGTIADGVYLVQVQSSDYSYSSHKQVVISHQ
jgi:Secretion system C-terminal sorting domain